MFTLDVKPAFGRLQGQVRLPPEMRLAELAWNAMQLDEQLIAMAVRRETRATPDAPIKTISCTKGCSACCHQVIPLSPPEAWMIADLVSSLPSEQRRKVLARFTDVRTTLTEKGFDQRSTDASATTEQLFSLAVDYFDLGLACPFLENDACSIHPQRPSICREFLVTSPPPLCSDLRKKAVRPVPMAAHLSECLSKLTARLFENEPVLVPLTSALDWAIEHQAEGRRRWDSTFLMQGLVDLINQTKPPAR